MIKTNPTITHQSTKKRKLCNKTIYVILICILVFGAFGCSKKSQSVSDIISNCNSLTRGEYRLTFSSSTESEQATYSHPSHSIIGCTDGENHWISLEMDSNGQIETLENAILITPHCLYFQPTQLLDYLSVQYDIVFQDKSYADKWVQVPFSMANEDGSNLYSVLIQSYIDVIMPIIENSITDKNDKAFLQTFDTQTDAAQFLKSIASEISTNTQTLLSPTTTLLTQVAKVAMTKTAISELDNYEQFKKDGYIAMGLKNNPTGYISSIVSAINQHADEISNKESLSASILTSYDGKKGARQYSVEMDYEYYVDDITNNASENELPTQLASPISPDSSTQGESASTSSGIAKDEELPPSQENDGPDNNGTATDSTNNNGSGSNNNSNEQSNRTKQSGNIQWLFVEDTSFTLNSLDNSDILPLQDSNTISSNIITDLIAHFYSTTSPEPIEKFKLNRQLDVNGGTIIQTTTNAAFKEEFTFHVNQDTGQVNSITLSTQTYDKNLHDALVDYYSRRGFIIESNDATGIGDEKIKFGIIQGSASPQLLSKYSIYTSVDELALQLSQ